MLFFFSACLDVIPRLQKAAACAQDVYSQMVNHEQRVSSPAAALPSKVYLRLLVVSMCSGVLYQFAAQSKGCTTSFKGALKGLLASVCSGVFCQAATLSKGCATSLKGALEGCVFECALSECYPEQRLHRILQRRT